MEAKPPKPLTLKKYGLTIEAWYELLERQGGVCAVCEKLPKSGRLCIDHDHRPRWRHKTPEERANAVRGLLCFFCNQYYVGRCITVEKSRRVTEYLERFAARW